MTRSVPFWLALAAGLFSSIVPASATPYADRVIAYSQGSTAANAYNNPSSALGEPSRITPAGPTDAPVTPFNPPWPTGQLVSIGAGGSITLELGISAQDVAWNPYGIDLILFGNNGFKVNDYSVPESEWTTDGTLFTFDPAGASTVWVSDNNQDYYELVVPSGLTAQVDSLFPTDASGDFLKPVNPSLTGADFAGKNLAGIKELYAGSAGGTGFDLAWARKSDGSQAGIASARFVRIEVSHGKIELDGIAAVPEPATWALFGLGLLGAAGLRSTAKRHHQPFGSTGTKPL
ncbi:MAG: PEP-CTERM sorting domain-containing protein [Verrucomicrobiales bacterium]|nr:PEP-CTERM sorting domain-containing protein [Verrucomicrobiales bacterium]